MSDPGSADELMADETLAGPGRAGSRVVPQSRGDLIDRYVVLDRLGAGAMGVVYAVYDPGLDRKVAIKLLQPLPGGFAAADHSRLQQEAQAMAKLNHPNVVTVHDVGEHQGQVFVAMEFVEGTTLTTWFDRQPRGWRETLAVLRQAGRGLAAAHAQGLVHRDFKPDNIMVGDDGSVRVMDFGLARPLRGVEPVTENGEGSAGSGREREPDVEASLRTQIVGTPAYMAPEVHAGRSATAASDQFSFCVAAYQLLYGQRPFAGETPAALAVAVLEGRLRPLPRGHGVPAWVGRVVLRGLSLAPEDRYPSLERLLEDLAADPGPLRRAALGVVVLGLVVAGALGIRALQARRALAQCEAESAAGAEVWDAEALARVSSALERTGSPFARSTADNLDAVFTDYVEQWGRIYRSTCAPELSDARQQRRRRACLEDRRLALVQTIELVESVDAPGVIGVLRSLELPSIEQCEGDDLERWFPDPDDDERTIALSDLRRVFARVESLSKLRRRDEARVLAEEALTTARAMEGAPLESEALSLLATLVEQAEGHGAAHPMLVDAFFLAGEAGRDETMARAALRVMSSASHQGKLEEAEHYRRLASMAMARMKVSDPQLAMAYDRRVGNFMTRAGRYEEALVHLERVLTASEARRGVGHPLVADHHVNLGLALTGMGNADEADDHFQTALDLYQEVYGPDHPQLSYALGNLAVSAGERGDHERALELERRVLRLHEQEGNTEKILKVRNNVALRLGLLGHHQAAAQEHRRILDIRVERDGPQSIHVAYSSANLAMALVEAGDLDQAEHHMDRALELFTALQGPDHPMVASALAGRGLVATARGEHERALELYRRALTIREAKLGAEHPEVADMLDRIGWARLALGDHDGAVTELRRAIEMQTAVSGADSPLLVHPLLGLGTALLEQGHPTEAVPLLERAMVLAAEAPPREVARVESVLARAVVDDDPERARALVERALDRYEPSSHSGPREALQAWAAEAGLPIAASQEPDRGDATFVRP